MRLKRWGVFFSLEFQIEIIDFTDEFAENWIFPTVGSHFLLIRSQNSAVDVVNTNIISRKNCNLNPASLIFSEQPKIGHKILGIYILSKGWH